MICSSARVRTDWLEGIKLKKFILTKHFQTSSEFTRSYGRRIRRQPVYHVHAFSQGSPFQVSVPALDETTKVPAFGMR